MMPATSLETDSRDSDNSTEPELGRLQPAPPHSSGIRVCHLIKSLGRGGAETLLVTTLRAADRTKATYSFGYLVPWKDALVEELRSEGVSVECFANGTVVGMMAGVWRLARFLKQWRVDILHCHLPVAGVVGRLAGRLAGVPVVYTEHNRLERYHPVTRRAHLATWPLQRRAIAVSESVRESICGYLGPEAGVVVVPNGVDTDHFQASESSASARARLGVPAGPVVGTVAVFRDAKRLDVWLDAADLIRQNRPEAQFIIVGDGPLRQRVSEIVRTRRLEDCVHLPGLHADVRPYLAAMDVFAMSSSVEGLPVALLEAMSMSRPVVSTSVGGIPEVICSGHNGVLVGSVEARPIAAAIDELLDSEPTRVRYGTMARQTIVRRFSVHEMTQKLEAIYASLLT